LSWNDKKKEEYKDLSKNDIKILIENINKNLKELNENISKLFSILLKVEEHKKESKNLEGYVSYNFEIPIPKLSRLEYWLIGKINKEATKYQIQYLFNKDKEERIIQVFVKKDQQNQEHIDHIIKCCKWVNKTLKENAERESQEKKSIPGDLL
jgi:hypothetical protein